MHEISAWLGSPIIDFQAAAARLLLTFLAAGLIGLEREARKQTAGWRTHIVIGLGATLMMILSIWLPQTINPGIGDPGRIAAQVVSGIGFLGAGAFIKIGNNIKGLTTAATLWATAGIGLTIGAGMWEISLFALGIVLLSLVLIEPLERKLFPTERLKQLQIWCTDGFVDRNTIGKVFKAYGVNVQSIDASQNNKTKDTRMTLLVRVPVNLDLDAFFTELRGSGKVHKVRLHESF